MRKRRILSLLLAVAVMATMLVAVPLTASAAGTLTFALEDKEYAADENFGDDTNISAIFKEAVHSSTGNAAPKITTNEDTKTNNNYPKYVPFNSSKDGYVKNIEITPKKNGVLKVYFYLTAASSSKDIAVKYTDNTSNQQNITVFVKGSTAKISNYLEIEKAQSGHTYAFTQSSTGNFGFLGFEFTPEEENPTIELNKTEISLNPGKSETVTGSLKYVAPGITANNITYTLSENSNFELNDNGDGTATITAKENVTTQDTATLTASCVESGATSVTCAIKGAGPLSPSYKDWLLGYNSSGSIGKATESSEAGKNVITIDEYNIYEPLDQIYVDGKLTFDTDLYIDNINDRTFRIYLENELAGNSQQSDSEGVIAEVLNNNVAGTFGNGVNGTSAQYTQTGWYHVTVTVDYSKSDNELIDVKVTAPDSGSEVYNATMGKAETSKSNKLKQIRLIKTAVAPKFAGMKFEQSGSSKTKDVTVNFSAGVKSVKLTSQTAGDKTYTVDFKRDGTTAMTSNGKASKTLVGVPVGKYNVTAEYADTYYEKDPNNPEQLEITDSEAPTLTINAKNKTITDEVNYAKFASGETYKWSFNGHDGIDNEYISWGGGRSGDKLYPDTYEKGVFLTVNTGSGKLNTTDRVNDAQINQGTTIQIPVVPGAKVTFDFRSFASGTTINGDAMTDKAVYEYKGNDAKLIEVKFTNGGYLNSIEIVTPKLFDDSANGSVSGYYYEGDIGRGDKLGVIRFFQGFAGVAVKDYGFVFVGADGNTSTAKEEKISGGESAALQPADVTGFFGTLTDIAENHFGEAVYAKGYVTIGDVTIFSDALITNEKVDSNNYVTDPTE